MSKVGCGMSATVEDDHLIFTQKFSSGYNLFVYAVGYNNVVGLIHTILYISDTTYDGILDKYMVDTMVDNIQETMEL